ncbi:MAG: sulfite exporter TauE/SafE family protein [Methyloceanibacter sp.]|uniref:sulfite exporter TauE/SafE family protein n=1 Tax=Methyloceanibacter sp. TaxID=1965321 RepID=UPI003D9ABABF
MWDDILLYVIIGFVAQMIDGAIGMAYGVTASSVLLSLGVPPATASACVHAAETFTTGASGFAHWRLGNVDRKLLVRLAVPGMIGGAIGAYVLSELPGDTLRPFISAYLLKLEAQPDAQTGAPPVGIRVGITTIIIVVGRIAVAVVGPVGGPIPIVVMVWWWCFR